MAKQPVYGPTDETGNDPDAMAEPEHPGVRGKGWNVGKIPR